MFQLYDDPKPMTCQCCGAPLKHGLNGWYCEYCGTRYIGGGTGQHSLRIVREPARTEHLACEMAVPRFAVMHDPEGVAECAMRHLSGEIADGIAQRMRYEVRQDPMTDAYIIRGDIGVVMPRSRSGVLDWGNTDDED